MAYAAASDVAGYCRNLLSSSANFSTSTSPTLSDVNRWLSSGCAIIETNLLSRGYSVPVPVDSGVRDWISELNALYAAARAELSRTVTSVQMGERTKGQVFDKMFWDGLSQLLGVNLSGAGVDTSATPNSMSLYVGGISQADKNAVASDTDRVEPRFYRGQFIAPNYDSAPTSGEEEG